MKNNLLRKQLGCQIFYIIPVKLGEEMKSSVSTLEHFHLKPLENLMSYDEHKLWLSTRRGELVTHGEGIVEREHNLLIELGPHDFDQLVIKPKTLLRQYSIDIFWQQEVDFRATASFLDEFTYLTTISMHDSGPVTMDGLTTLSQHAKYLRFRIWDQIEEPKSFLKIGL